jgi:hypothetical protein
VKHDIAGHETGGATDMKLLRCIIPAVALALAACSSTAASSSTGSSTVTSPATTLSATTQPPTPGSSQPVDTPGTTPASTTAAPAALPTGWLQYRPSDDSFTVGLPGSATEMQSLVPIAGGTATATSAIVLDGSGRNAFVVSWLDYPAGALTGRSPEALLAIGQASVTASASGGVTIVQQAIDLDGYPGRAWTTMYRNGIVAGRAYLVGSRFYLLQALVTDADTTAKARIFFDSFRLVP